MAAITRDYLEDPQSGRRATWAIEADAPPATYRQDDVDLARRLRAMTTWLREQAVRLVRRDPETDRQIMRRFFPSYHEVFADRHGEVWIAVKQQPASAQ